MKDAYDLLPTIVLSIVQVKVPTSDLLKVLMMPSFQNCEGDI